MNTRTLTCLLLLAATSWTALAQTPFTKITEGDIVNDLGENFKRGAWGDFNNDGYLDLFVNYYGGTNLFYRNNTNGTFTKITQGDMVVRADTYVSASWADYDNDGNLDLLSPAGYLAEPTPSYIFLYHNKGDGTFDRLRGSSVVDQAGYYGATLTDYDNDGFLDLLVCNVADFAAGGKFSLFHNDGAGNFTNAPSTAFPSDITTPWAALFSDYDKDGFADLLIIANDLARPNLLYHNNRNGTFSRVLTNAIAEDIWTGGGARNGGAWGDYDNDGLPDLFLTAGPDTENCLYHNEGNGAFTKITSAPMLPHQAGAQSTGCAWGDYDNDGYLDLFVSSVHGRNQLFHNNGDGTFTEILSGAPQDDGRTNTWYFGVSWVDYDNDGFLDLFVAGGDTDQGPGKNVLYHNDGNTNSWLEIKCLGTVSNRSAIGAKVRARATIGGKTFWQMREVTANFGYSSSPLVAHFGLGNAPNVEMLRIEWPSGIVQEIAGVAARQVLTVTEPPRLSANVTNGVPLLTLKGGRGFHYRIEASEDVRVWTSLGDLTITNLNGTVSLTDENAPGFAHRFYRAAQLGQ